MHIAKAVKPFSLLDYSAALQERLEVATSADARKERGQVFTPPSVCRFMAGLFTRIPDCFRLLDAGAGGRVFGGSRLRADANGWFAPAN